MPWPQSEEDDRVMRKTTRRWIAVLLAQFGMFDLALRARGWHPIGGGQDPDPDPDPKPDPPPDPKPDPDPPPDPKPDPDPDPKPDDKVDEDTLPDAVKAILRKERRARRDAEKRAKDAEAKVPKPDPDPKPDPKPDPDPADKVTEKLRRANLRGALAENGVGTDKVKAAMKLIDIADVEFDDDDEPTNLGDVLEDAFETYPFLKGESVKRRAPDINGKDGKDNKPTPLTADELDAATRAGKSPEEWTAMKGVSNLDDWNALQAKKAKAKQ